METVNSQIALEEAVQLGAVDDEFYARFFFPKTARQKSPPFHKDMDEALNGPDRFVAFEIFRGGAKTTKVRLYLSKKVAYAQSRTIIVVGKSQDHARRTIEWLMTQAEYNTLWAQTFGLVKGKKKWTSEEVEIYHEADEIPIRVIALGITGSTRGINVDDYRPDLIIIDDPCDEENTATLEAREKTDDFINGSLRNSLAPASEAPHAKMVFLQTLLNSDDSIARCEHDPKWKFLRFGIFTEDGHSSWPERWSDEELAQEKESFIARGKLHLWMREMECKIISDATSAFKVSQLEYWETPPPKEECVFFMAIDPVPPPSDRELQQGLRGKDSEVIAVIARFRNKYFLIDYAISKGHDPDWTVAKFFEFKQRYSPRSCFVESINYQRSLKWLIEKAMARRGEWMQIDDGTRNGTQKADRRKKTYRIIDVIGSVVAERKLVVHRGHSEFIEQFAAYPAVNHDDVIEAVSMAIRGAIDAGGVYEGDYELIEEAEADIPTLEFEGGCP